MNQRDKIGYQQGIISIIVNTILFGLKYWAGIVSGSVALIADAWHSLSDSLSSIVVIGGIKLASRKPTKKHPFGFGRWEQLAAIFIAFLLAIVAYEFFRESVAKLESRESAHFGTIAIIVSIASIIMNEGLTQYSFWTYRKTGNQTLKADGWHHRSDALSSVIVLGGIFLGRFIWWIDSALGIIISLLLFYAVYEILNEAITKILGEKPPDALMQQIHDTIINIHGSELQPHHFHIHNYGTHTELTFHIKLDENTDIKTGHEIATNIERGIKKKLNIETTIHIEPKN